MSIHNSFIDSFKKSCEIKYIIWVLIIFTDEYLYLSENIKNPK